MLSVWTQQHPVPSCPCLCRVFSAPSGLSREELLGLVVQGPPWAGSAALQACCSLKASISPLGRAEAGT